MATVFDKLRRRQRRQGCRPVQPLAARESSPWRALVSVLLSGYLHRHGRGKTRKQSVRREAKPTGHLDDVDQGEIALTRRRTCPRLPPVQAGARTAPIDASSARLGVRRLVNQVDIGAGRRKAFRPMWRPRWPGYLPARMSLKVWTTSSRARARRLDPAGLGETELLPASQEQAIDGELTRTAERQLTSLRGRQAQAARRAIEALARAAVRRWGTALPAFRWTRLAVATSTAAIG
jgi:hypothetical protein